MRWSRELPSVPSSVTIIREPDGHFYVSFVVEVTAVSAPHVDREAGVDVGIFRLATIATSDGVRTRCGESEVILAPRCASCGRLEREKSRRRKDQPIRDKSRRKVAIAHSRGHTGAARSSPQTGLGVGMREPSNPRRRPQHRSGWSKTVDSPVPSAMPAGDSSCESSTRKPTATDAPFIRFRGGCASSKTCSACGHRLDDLPLSIRTWTCRGCGVTHDRDYNAAKVILAAGQAERLNARGAHIRPQSVAAMGVEAGSNPAAA